MFHRYPLSWSFVGKLGHVSYVSAEVGGWPWRWWWRVIFFHLVDLNIGLRVRASALRCAEASEDQSRGLISPPPPPSPPQYWARNIKRLVSVNIWSFPGCPLTPLWGGEKAQTLLLWDRGACWRNVRDGFSSSWAPGVPNYLVATLPSMPPLACPGPRASAPWKGIHA